MLARDGLPVDKVSVHVVISSYRVNRSNDEVEYAPEGSTNLVTLQNVSVFSGQGSHDLLTAAGEGAATYALAGLKVNL